LLIQIKAPTAYVPLTSAIDPVGITLPEEAVEMRLIILGPPGAGKGTQATRIAARYAIAHVATGDMLRVEVAAGSSVGEEARAVMQAGGLVCDDILIRMLAARLDRADAARGFILDGFPRTLVQALAFDNLLKTRARRLTAVISLTVDEAALIGRIAGRFACGACGAAYHDTLRPPRRAGHCDNCGGTQFTRRADDNAATVQARLVAYHQQTAPLLPYYDAQHRLFRVNGMAAPEAVFAAITAIVDEEDRAASIADTAAAS